MVLGHSLGNSNNSLFPEHLVDSSSIRPGNGGKYVDMAKGKDGEVCASIDQLNNVANIRVKC